MVLLLLLYSGNYGQLIFIYVESQDLRGKVGKGGVAGGTRLLGTDRSQSSLEDSSMIEILQMGGAGQGNSARAT